MDLCQEKSVYYPMVAQMITRRMSGRGQNHRRKCSFQRQGSRIPHPNPALEMRYPKPTRNTGENRLYNGRIYSREY